MSGLSIGNLVGQGLYCFRDFVEMAAERFRICG